MGFYICGMELQLGEGGGCYCGSERLGLFSFNVFLVMRFKCLKL